MAVEFLEVFPNLQKANSHLFILKLCWQDRGSYNPAIWLLKWELEEQRWGKKGPQSSWCCWDWWRKLESAEMPLCLKVAPLPYPTPHSDMVTSAVSWWFLPLELSASHWSQGRLWSSAPNPSSSSRRRARPQCSCVPEGWGAQEESGRQTSCFCFPEASPAPGDAAVGRGESAEQAAKGSGPRQPWGLCRPWTRLELWEGWQLRQRARLLSLQMPLSGGFSSHCSGPPHWPQGSVRHRAGDSLSGWRWLPRNSGSDLI